jgi:uncharacterized protein YecE (DUF72 family)
MHSRPPAAVPNTPEPTSNRTGPEFKWNAELGQPIPKTPEPIAESTPESTAEAMPTATTQTEPRDAQFMAEVVASGIVAGMEALQRTTTKPQTPEYKKKRSYGGQVIYNNKRQAKRPSLTDSMTKWTEITEDKFTHGYRDSLQIEDVRKWAEEIKKWVPEAEMFRMFADIGYCVVLNPATTTFPPDATTYTTDHTTKYYYTPHVDPCSAWPDGVEQHVDAFFNTHPEAKRDNALWGFLM